MSEDACFENLFKPVLAVELQSTYMNLHLLLIVINLLVVNYMNVG